MASAIQAICRRTLAQSILFLAPAITLTGDKLHIGTCPTRPIPRCPRIIVTVTLQRPGTSPRLHITDHTVRRTPSLRHVPSYNLPDRPLKIVELCGGLAAGLEAFLEAGHAVTSYGWSNTKPGCTRGGLSPPYLLHKPIFVPPPTGGHIGLGLSPNYGHPDHFPNKNHYVNPRGSTHLTYQPADVDTTHPQSSQLANPIRAWRPTPSRLPNPIRRGGSNKREWAPL